jgi:hypothetical protein
MYITAVPNRNSPPAILLRESFRDGDQVRTRTLANLTSWAPERIEALRRALKGEFDGFTGEVQPVCGPIFAVLFALKQLAERVGLLQVLGTERWAKLVLLKGCTEMALPPLRAASNLALQVSGTRESLPQLILVALHATNLGQLLKEVPLFCVCQTLLERSLFIADTLGPRGEAWR